MERNLNGIKVLIIMKFNALIPELRASDFKRSLKFYTKILGFKVEYERRESQFAFLSFQGAQIMIEQNTKEWNAGKLNYPYGRGINLQIAVKKIFPLLNSLRKNKYKIYVEPFEKWYRVKNKLNGIRQFLVQDPDGYLLRFTEELEIKKMPKK